MNGEDFVLVHASNYDPVKAREYYLRTRKLKGRTPGSGAVESMRGSGRVQGKPTPGKKPITIRPKSKQSAKARVAQLKARLEELENILERLTKLAKARSGVETEPKKSESKKTDSKADTGKKKEKTPAQKREDLKRLEKYREKNKGGGSSGGSSGSSSKSGGSSDSAKLEAKIDSVQKRIAKLRKELASKPKTK